MLHCPHCKVEHDATTLLSCSDSAWPLPQWLWCECPACHERFHLHARDGELATIQVLGSPGAEFRTIETMPCSDLRTRQDPAFLHCWLGEVHYEYAARE